MLNIWNENYSVFSIRRMIIRIQQIVTFTEGFIDITK